MPTKPSQAVTQSVNVKFKKLPFYDIHGELVKPTSLVTQGSSRFQEAQFQFLLSPEQATNKPNVEPKRPPRPVHITPLCKLTPTLNNIVSVKWAADYGKNWVVGIWLVEKLSSTQLLERLTTKGKRNPDFTRELIKKKLTDDEVG